jgi:hypothetical protein
LNRLAFVETKIDVDNPDVYDHQYNVVHVDEKWFYVSKPRRKTYITVNEEAPIESVRNKNFIEKVMFLAAVMRPQRQRRGIQNEDPDDWFFKGKIGVYPMVTYRHALRDSQYRPAGTLLVDNLKITRRVYENFLVDKVLPDIRRKVPLHIQRGTIYIQQDNATPHRINMERFNEKCATLGLVDCRIMFQPSQSPDFNICDLSFFPSIQSIYQTIPGVKDSLTCINAVNRAFESYDPNLLNRAFLSLFMNYNMTKKFNGSNKYPVPHMGKERLEREGLLPTTIPVWNLIDEVPDEILLDNMSDDENYDALSMDENEVIDDDDDEENNNEDESNE